MVQNPGGVPPLNHAKNFFLGCGRSLRCVANTDGCNRHHPAHLSSFRGMRRPEIECNFAVAMALFRSLCFGEPKRTSFLHLRHLRNLWILAALIGLRAQPALGPRHR
jgi:hypothetical protein